MRAVAIAVAVAVIALLGGRVARADDADATAARAFHDDEQLAARDATAAMAAFEALGAARPLTRWSDDAWTSAARLAEKAGDYDRARRDLAAALAITTDDLLRRRASAELARLQTITGASGQWSAIAAQHDTLAAQVLGRGDPKPALAALAALLAANPGYPRATAVRLVMAAGWERDGELARAIEVLRAAVAAAPADGPDERGRALLALARAQIHHGELADADATARRLAANPGVDPRVVGEVRDELATAQHRGAMRIALVIVLVVLAAASVIALRRATGSWRASLRAVAWPPSEVWFLGPIALVLIGVAATGNPLVSRAVRVIALSGVVVAWLSGAIAEAARRRHGRLGLARALAHAAAATIAISSAAYLVIAHDRMIDLVTETWRTGPTAR